MLKPETSYLVDLNLEILNGCKHRCYGCQVDKGQQDGFVAGDQLRLVAFMRDLRDHGLLLSNLAIGPTDFMASNNTLQMFEESSELIRLFPAITLQSTFTERDEVIYEWAARLEPYLRGRQVKLAFPLDPRHYGNLKYIQQTFDKIRLFREVLTESTYTKTIVLLNLKVYDDPADDPINQVVEELIDIDGKRIHVDFIVPDTRRDMSDILNRDALRKALRYLTRLHEGDYLKPEVRTALAFNQFYTENSGDDRDRQGRRYEDFDLAYRNGDFYHAAFFGEDTVFFDEAFRVPNTSEWSYAGLLKESKRLAASQYAYACQIEQCMDCQWLSRCEHKKILQVMRLLNTHECLGMQTAMNRFYKV